MESAIQRSWCGFHREQIRPGRLLRQNGPDESSIAVQIYGRDVGDKARKTGSRTPTHLIQAGIVDKTGGGVRFVKYAGGASHQVRNDCERILRSQRRVRGNSMNGG